jgi:hypothetical protein
VLAFRTVTYCTENEETPIPTGSGYAVRVLKAYAVAWPVAFMGVLLMRPLVVRLVKWTVVPPKP